MNRIVESVSISLAKQNLVLQQCIEMISMQKSKTIAGTSDANRVLLVTALSFYEQLRENLIQENRMLNDSVNSDIKQLVKYVDIFKSTTMQPALLSAITSETLHRIDTRFEAWNSLVKFVVEITK